LAKNPGIFDKVFGRIINGVQSQISAITKWTTKAQNFGYKILQEAQKKTSRFIRHLAAKPRSKKDYWKILGIYFSKKLVVTTIAGIGAFIHLYVTLIVPNLEGKLWHAKLSTDMDKLQQFSGKAKIWDIDGRFIYKGQMSAGKPSGFGVQYDLDGKLVYRGHFGLGQYSGEGEIYDKRQNTIYRGNFKNNKFDGSGQQFNSFGKVIFVGSFEKGMRSGRGTEYDPKTGKKKYYGEFINNKYDGKGVLYSYDGELISYEGDFKEGFYDGEGKQYKDGHLIYLGEFKDGKYSGTGTLYNISSGEVLYSGEFKNGLYDGEGKLYDTHSAKIIYEGKFENGKRKGKGVLYDKLGIPIFEGDFRDDSIDYVSHFDSPLDGIKASFGKESATFNSDNKKILLYNVIDTAMILAINSEGEYVLEKVVIGTKNDFMGIGVKSTPIERRYLIGQAFTSTNFASTVSHKSAFSALEIRFDDYENIPTDKYVFEKYFIRLFFNTDRSELRAIEIGKT